MASPRLLLVRLPLSGSVAGPGSAVRCSVVVRPGPSVAERLLVVGSAAPLAASHASAAFAMACVSVSSSHSSPILVLTCFVFWTPLSNMFCRTMSCMRTHPRPMTKISIVDAAPRSKQNASPMSWACPSESMTIASWSASKALATCASVRYTSVPSASLASGSSIWAVTPRSPMTRVAMSSGPVRKALSPFPSILLIDRPPLVATATANVIAALAMLSGRLPP